MTFGFGMWGRANGNQVTKALGTFSLERLRKEVDGVGWVLRGLGCLT